MVRLAIKAHLVFIVLLAEAIDLTRDYHQSDGDPPGTKITLMLHAGMVRL